MSRLRVAILNERYEFHWNLVSILACLVLVGLSSLAWLHDDLGPAPKITIESLCCALMAIDLYFHRHEMQSLLTRTALRSVTLLALIPWYTVVTSVMRLPEESTIIFLAHASFAPYLYFRFRAYSREHIAPRFVRVTLVLVLAFFCLHWLASVWMVLRPRTDVDFTTEYNLAMYFLMTTVATVGYGDIVPTDNLSRIYTMGLQLLGVCMFGVVIGQVSRLIIDADKRKEHINGQLESLASLCRHYGVPLALQKKAYRFLNHVLTHRSNEDEERVMAALPRGLQSELRKYMNMRPISKVSLFQGCPEACLMDAAAELQQIYFTPDQPIIRKGETGEVMYLIGHGQVEVHDGSRHIAQLADGQVFGELALIGEETRAADVTAVSHTDAFVLTRERFQHLMDNHAALRENVGRIAAGRRRAS